MRDNIIVVMALEAEGKHIFEKNNIPILYCGVGKVNAAYHLLEYLHHNPHINKVFNCGTAGSMKHQKGTVLSCTKFAQRDMDVSPLGFKKGQTPFDENIDDIITHPIFIQDLPQGICATGDNFAVDPQDDIFDALDMEAYALAKICYLKKIDFTAVKYISDGANQEAAKDWQENIDKAADQYLENYYKL